MNFDAITESNLDVMRKQTSALLKRLYEIGDVLGTMQRDTSALGVLMKPDGSPVCSADKYAAEAIATFIQNDCPGENLLCEDFPTTQSTDFSSGVLWIVDPLDNTRGYLNGQEDYSVLLAKFIDGKAEAAFVLHPARRTITWATKGGGTYRDNVKINCSDCAELGNSRRIGAYAKHLSNVLKPPSESTEAIIAVADGSVDIAFVLICGHKVWDIAFAYLLIEEAGGRVSDEGGQPLVLHGIEIPHRWIIASNRHLHNDALSIVKNLTV